MKKLKIKLWRVENVVLMKVLEQDKSLSSKGVCTVFESKEMQIVSINCPALSKDTIYLRGTNKDLDNDIVCFKLNNIDEAKRYIDKVKRAIKEYNSTICCNKTISAEDIETRIVE